MLSILSLSLMRMHHVMVVSQRRLVLTILTPILQHWVQVGAQPTDTVRNILSDEGVYLKKHLLGGVKKGAFDEAAADAKFDAWKKEKENKLAAAQNKKAQDKKAQAAERLAAEKKINEEIAKKVAEKKAAEAAAKAEAEAAKAAEESAPAEEAPAEA